MRILTADPPPPELAAVIERRRVHGQDRHDEVWEGVYHLTAGPSGRHAVLEMRLAAVLLPYAERAVLIQSGGFNLGDGPDDYRVPDGGYHRVAPLDVWIPTAAVVVEILSPDDETYAKFSFYEGRRVEEIIVVDPEAHAVTIWTTAGRGEGFGSQRGSASALLDVGAADVEAAIDWP